MKRLMWIAALTLLNLALHPASALAREGLSGCWAREYDADHMRKNPNQRVKSMVLLIDSNRSASPFSEKPNFKEGMLKATFVNDREAYAHEVMVYCRDIGGTMSCQPSFGGKPIFTARREVAGGPVVVRNLALHFNPAGYSAEDMAENAIRLKADNAHSLFRLTPAGGQSCKY